MWRYSNISVFLFPAVIACGVVGFLCAVFLLLLLAYRMKKKDEGSYDLGDTKVPPTAYQKAPTKEFYAWTGQRGTQECNLSPTSHDWEWIFWQLKMILLVEVWSHALLLSSPVLLPFNLSPLLWFLSKLLLWHPFSPSAEEDWRFILSLRLILKRLICFRL